SCSDDRDFLAHVVLRRRPPGPDMQFKHSSGGHVTLSDRSQTDGECAAWLPLDSRFISAEMERPWSKQTNLPARRARNLFSIRMAINLAGRRLPGTAARSQTLVRAT